MPPLAALPIADTPVAVLDFETTGLRPGPDRVVEVAVVRIDPGQPPRVVLDTLVNPGRPMACTEIHGISKIPMDIGLAFLFSGSMLLCKKSYHAQVIQAAPDRRARQRPGTFRRSNA